MKKFLIIGNGNAVTYKEIFPLIKNNELWLGINTNGHNMSFVNDGKIKDVTAVWFTNLDHAKRHEQLDLYKRYNAEEFPHYDNYDAIEVSKVCDIPLDYDGAMGVPITFLEKYCPEQFEIIGSFNNSSIEDKEKECYVLSNDTPTIINGVEKVWNGPVINMQPLYKRICIRRK